MITWFSNHHSVMVIMSYLLVALMLCSCISPVSQRAEAVVTEVGLVLIVAIFATFGLVVSFKGAIDGIPLGIDELMSEFSKSIHGDPTWLRGQFNAHISFASWGLLQLAGTLVDAIREFIDWLRNYQSLSANTPITHTYYELKTEEATYPIIQGTSYSLADPYDYTNMQMVINHPDPDSFTSVNHYIPGGINSEFTIVSNNFYTGISFKPITFSDPYFNNAFYLNTNIPISEGLPIYGNQTQTIHYAVQYDRVQNGYRYNTYAYVGDVVPSVLRSDAGVLNPPLGRPDIRERGGWSINDDNLDLSYLDDESGKSRDVYFNPSIPDTVGSDLSNIGSIEKALEKQLEYTKSKTGVAEISGSIAITETVDPGGGSNPSDPSGPILVAPNNWFTSIWHYVVKALQDSAAGISFVMNLISVVIPPQILNLCWAACVLLITFGIINKFLK